MRTYTIALKTSDMSWNSVESLPIDLVQLGCDAPIKAQAQICYDDTALYVRLSAEEENIRAEVTDRLGEPCEDSCLEFFFSPIWGDTRYLNIEYNPNGCYYLGFGNNVGGDLVLYRVAPDEDPFNPKISRETNGWNLEYSIPYSFVRHFFPDFNPKSGYKMRANCYKCGDKTVKPHYFAWSPLIPGAETFHTPESFGTMIFE